MSNNPNKTPAMSVLVVRDGQPFRGATRAVAEADIVITDRGRIVKAKLNVTGSHIGDHGLANADLAGSQEGHASDCAVHNAPAYPPGPCNCGATSAPAVGGAESAGAMLSRVRDDAGAWAAEFRQTAIRLGYSDMDEGWLIGWFANAIENTEVVRRGQWEARAKAAENERDGLKTELAQAAEARDAAGYLGTVSDCIAYLDGEIAQVKREHEASRTAFNAAIDFAIDEQLEGIEFLRCWREGDWQAIERDWQEFDLTTTGQWPVAAPKGGRHEHG